MSKDATERAKELFFPYYINQGRLLDIYAILNDGYSEYVELTTAVSEQKAKGGKADVSGNGGFKIFKFGASASGSVENINSTGKHWKIRLPQYEHFTRLDTLDEHWTPQEIRRTMGRGAYYGNRRPMVFVPQNIPEEYRTPYKLKEKKSNFYRLYMHYCYLLGILPDKKVPQTVSPYLKADIRKMEQISAEARYMAKYNIQTLEELYADRENLQGQLSELIAARTKLQNKIRRTPAEQKEPLRKEKADITAQITDIRKRLKWNEGIETRSVKMQKDIDLFYANEDHAREAAKQKQRAGRER